MFGRVYFSRPRLLPSKSVFQYKHLKTLRSMSFSDRHKIYTDKDIKRAVQDVHPELREMSSSHFSYLLRRFKFKLNRNTGQFSESSKPNIV